MPRLQWIVGNSLEVCRKSASGPWWTGWIVGFKSHQHWQASWEHTCKFPEPAWTVKSKILDSVGLETFNHRRKSENTFTFKHQSLLASSSIYEKSWIELLNCLKWCHLSQCQMSLKFENKKKICWCGVKRQGLSGPLSPFTSLREAKKKCVCFVAWDSSVYQGMDTPIPSLLAWENAIILPMPLSLFSLHLCKRL